jgi:26S proteasome regulatory subunit N3
MEKAQDVEMKDVSDDPKVTKEGDKEKPQEKEKDADTLTVEDVREQLKLIERGVSQKEQRYISRALRSLPSLRKKLNDNVMRRLVSLLLPQASPVRETLLQYLTEPMDTSSRPRSTRGMTLSCESECFLHLLVLLLVLDGGNLDQARNCADALMERLSKLNSRMLDLIAAKCYFYYARVYELQGHLARIRSTLHSRLRTATLRHDEEGQAVLLNLLLRNLLHYNLYDQADKLIAKSKFPESASNNEWTRYLFYTGRIRAIQLEYSEAYSKLMQAIRKAPQNSAIGFKQTANKFMVVVQLLLGEIPERSIFREEILKRPLLPYFHLAQAVHSGDLGRFNEVVRASQGKFQQDKTYTLIIRLRHNVIKTGIKMISLSYSRISLSDIAEKLSLESTQDAEYIVAKAIRDGTIEAVINHGEGYVQSKETVDIYATREPQEAFHQRIVFCLELHNQSVKAMRYPPKAFRGDEDSNKERLEREQQDIELAQEMADEDDDDEGDFP